METIGIIVAAGKGIRMGAGIRKQYMRLEGLPLLCHAVRAFDVCPEIHRILLVIPEEDAAYCREEILPCIPLKCPVTMVHGGTKRQESVYNALLTAGESVSLVAIHDGVRPLVHPRHIQKTLDCAASTGAAVLAVPATDTLKRIDDHFRVRETIDRKEIWIAQTPQSFRYPIIRDAHEKARQTGYTATDDAELVEQAGYPVKLVHGSRFNIKVTLAEDLIMAKVLFPLMESEDFPRFRRGCGGGV
ncbi:MAG: 2-C-methyl-D-erythritol 4-phosphate cytidylyltransferase [Deltaproteobacteria bacterium]|nr:2-C-methyl-D-erythritol 4-phosphate cytidylyltransferase [Deltaproteobacteria bacterium]